MEADYNHLLCIYEIFKEKEKTNCFYIDIGDTIYVRVTQGNS